MSVASLLAASGTAPADRPPQPADLMLWNGKVVTVDAAVPEVEAIAVWICATSGLRNVR